MTHASITDDGLPIDEVGAWTKEKHTRLRKYIGITSATRRKWIQGSGCATYIDLFCGTGRAVIRDSGEWINGSPLVAFEASRESGVPFSEIHIADISQESSKAAERRLRTIDATPTVHVGEATNTALEIVKTLNPRGLHFVFLDPYKLEPLSFSIIETFASLRYVDLLIHISVLDLQRNMERYADTIGGPLDRFAPGWRMAVNLKQSKAAARAAFTSGRNEAAKLIAGQPDYAEALCVLGMADAALGDKEDAIREGRRAVELLPVTKDAIIGSKLVQYLSLIYAWTGEKDLALEQLSFAARIPGYLSYGQLRLHPYWDPLRGDPRFEEIVASLAPK